MPPCRRSFERWRCLSPTRRCSGGCREEVDRVSGGIGFHCVGGEEDGGHTSPESAGQRMGGSLVIADPRESVAASKGGRPSMGE
ncbi:hypothetical protein QJS10_CPA05g01612 [Acorus calamus]|uniref:Uncharacterized protein n=1 Tax=Acorus calamus TaxID=4465 RepID=A0AAV9EU72_ACOCL|nr:hypothetical protein QJS10_CPA05g01612 [Acorus calamus]